MEINITKWLLFLVPILQQDPSDTLLFLKKPCPVIIPAVFLRKICAALDQPLNFEIA